MMNSLEPSSTPSPEFQKALNVPPIEEDPFPWTPPETLEAALIELEKTRSDLAAMTLRARELAKKVTSKKEDLHISRLVPQIQKQSAELSIVRSELEEAKGQLKLAWAELADENKLEERLKTVRAKK
jgi:hypothetical protein